MSSADNIARTILEMGQIRAQGLERAAQAQAQAQANTGQIWAGALGQLGQLPGQIAGMKLADTENKIRQQQLDRAKQQQNDEFNASQIFGYVTRPTQDGSTQFNEERLNDLAQRMAGAGIHPETQQKMFSAFKQGNEIIDSFRQEQLAHQARFAQAVLDSATPDNPLTPGSALMAAKVAQANGLGNAQDIDKFMQAINQGHDPTEVFKAIVKAGSQPTQMKPPTNDAELAWLAAGGNPQAKAALNLAKPPKAPEAPKGFTNEIELRQDAATQGTSEETPTAWQSAETLRQMAEDKAKTPTAKEPPALGSFPDYVKRRFGDNPTAAQIEAARKTYGQADDRVNVNVNGPNDVALTPDSIEGLGAAWRILGNAAIPTRFNDADKKRVINAGTEQRKALGQSAVEGVQRQAAYQGDKAALTKMKTMSAAAEAFENKALAQTDIISDLSKKVPRTQFPIINSALQSGRTNITGDENATKLANAIETFSAEYAKIMNGSVGSAAASSDASRSAARRLINAGMNQGTMQGVIDLMKKEMALTLQGYGATIDHITNRMGGTPEAPAPTTPATTGPKILSITPVR